MRRKLAEEGPTTAAVEEVLPAKTLMLLPSVAQSPEGSVVAWA